MTNESKLESRGFDPFLTDRRLDLLLRLADFIVSHTHEDQPNEQVVSQVAHIRRLAVVLRSRDTHGQRPTAAELALFKGSERRS